MGYFYIFGTILFTVYGQVVLKWRIVLYGTMPDLIQEKIVFLLRLFLDPFIMSGFFAAFLAALCWMAAMTKFDLSHAYPFMGLSFVLVLVLSGIIFNEIITPYKIVGTLLVVIGIMLGGK